MAVDERMKRIESRNRGPLDIGGRYSFAYESSGLIVGKSSRTVSPSKVEVELFEISSAKNARQTTLVQEFVFYVYIMLSN